MIDLNKALPRWTDGRLRMSPGYYVGRGPTTSDLDASKLEAIY